MSSDLGGINSVFPEDVFVKSTLSRYLDIITKLLWLSLSHMPSHTHQCTHTHDTHKFRTDWYFECSKSNVLKMYSKKFIIIFYYYLLLLKGILLPEGYATIRTFPMLTVSTLYPQSTL